MILPNCLKIISNFFFCTNRNWELENNRSLNSMFICLLFSEQAVILSTEYLIILYLCIFSLILLISLKFKDVIIIFYSLLFSILISFFLFFQTTYFLSNYTINLNLFNTIYSQLIILMCDNY